MYSNSHDLPARKIYCGNAVRKKRKRHYKKNFKIFLLLLFVFCIAKMVIYFKASLSVLQSNNENSLLQLQNPELPNGCEATSLAMAITASGIPCDKLTAYKAIPSTEFYINDKGNLIGGDPENTYTGDAASEGGFYCFTAPVALAANAILQQKLSDKKAFDITGAPLSELDEYLNQQQPIVIWVTKELEAPRFCTNYSWKIGDEGKTYLPYSNLHCVMLNSVKNGVYEIFDPLSSVIKVEKNLLNQIYTAMGCRAVVIY